MNNFYKDFEWKKFKTLDGEPFYYFPDNLTLIEYDEDFGKLITDLKNLDSLDEIEKIGPYPEGYVEEVLHNMDVLSKRGLLSKIKPSLLPDYIPLGKVIIANTMKCNLTCTYCYNKFDFNSCTSGKLDMSKETFLELIKFLEHNGKDLPFYKIFVIGGEPLMNLEILEEAGKWGKRLRKAGRDLFIAITTNATLINREIIDFAMKYRINLKLTIDGDKKEHDRNRTFPDGSGTYEKILTILPDYFHTYRNSSKYVTTTINTFKDDLEGKIIRFAAMGFNIIDLSEIYFTENEEEYTLEELEKIFREKYRSVFEFLNLRIRSRNYIRIIPLHGFIQNIFNRFPSFTRCNAGLDSLAVSSDGTIYPCHHFFGDERFALGTVFDRKIGSDKLKNYRTAVMDRLECSRCWARLLCGGPCYHRSLAVTGDAFKCNKMGCIRIKALILEAMRFYIKLKNEDLESLKWFMNIDKHIKSL